MINNLDHIGAEAIRLMTGADRDVAKAQAHIKQVWDAFTAAEEAGTTITINGVSLKKNWAKLINRTTRYCQMIAKDGDRKNQKKSDANSVRPLALLRQLITAISENRDYAIIKGEAQEICDTLKWYPPTFKQENKEVRKFFRTGEMEDKKPIKHAHASRGSTWCGKDSAHSNMASQKRHATCPFCIDAMAANIRVIHPDADVRRVKNELESKRTILKSLERGDLVLPEYRDDRWHREQARIPQQREEIAKLEAELEVLKQIKTPEQAVALAKEREAKRQAERARKAALPRHYQQGNEERTLCGLDINDETPIVWGKGTPATCPKCLALQPTPDPERNDAPIKIKLTEAQARLLDLKGRTLVYAAADYQEAAKKEVLRLETLHSATVAESSDYRRNNGHLLDWTDKSEHAVDAKERLAHLTGQIKASEGAIRAIIAGDLNSDDPNRHIREWYEHHQAELEIAAEEKYQLAIKTLDQSYVHAVKCDTNPPGSQSHCALDLTGGDYKTNVEREKITCPRCRMGFDEERLAQTPDEEEEPSLTIHTQGHRVRR